MRRLPARALVVALLLMTALVLSGCGSDDDTATDGSSSSSSTTSTTVPSTRPDTAIWPFGDSDTRYAEPAQAAESFAVDYLGFTTPVIGPFATADDGAGTVGVQPTATGPVTTVAVRQLTSDESWWVEGATTPSLQLEVPAAGASIATPVTLSGQSTAFEGTVPLQIREDGTVEPIGSDFVQGGANGEMGPFSKPIPFTAPTATTGAIVLLTRSAEDGTVREAAVTRVQFG